MRRNGALFGFGWRLVVACVLSTVAFFWIITPWGLSLLGPRVGTVIGKSLDAPVSFLNWVLRGLGSGVFLFPESPARMLARYLAVGVPAYLGLLYIPAATGWLLRKRESRAIHGA